MPPLSVLIKPASGNCNLRCRYCFYYDITEKRDVKNYGIMAADTLETIVKKLLSEATDSCTFAFQGGEPTLAGLDFYKQLILFQKKHNLSGCKINNAIQTNGIVIDDDWARFFAEHDFLVGISLDGPPDIHNHNRIDANNDGTSNRVMKTIRLFDKYKVRYNILYVVTALAAKHPQKIYSYFKKQGYTYWQFIPCLDPYGEKRGGSAYSLTPKLYAEFLKTTFDLWYEDITKGNIISIRFFENLVGMAAGIPPEACGMSGVCQCQFVIEADGSVYPCDFYVFDEYKMGNIHENSFREMFEDNTAREFVKNSCYVDPDCKQCRWYGLCRGGCRRDRDYNGDGKLQKNYYCSAFKTFFEYSAPRIAQLARMIRPY